VHRPASEGTASSLPVDSDRANLLAAIRGFEMTKLRTGERKLKRKKKREDVADSSGKALGGGGDLMSDLTKQLQLRRIGISGGSGKTSSGDGASGASDTDTGRRSQNALGRVSELIPPPPPKPHTDRLDSHDDDWLDS